MFMAPELLGAEGSYDYSVDVFAFAVLICILFEPPTQMDDGKPVPKNSYQLMMRIAKGVRYRRPKGIPDSLWQLVTECWQQEAEKRPTFAEIIEKLKKSMDLTFPGTNLTAYKEFQDRITQECVSDARPIEMIDDLCNLLDLNDIRDRV
jgi:hypothetical protein